MAQFLPGQSRTDEKESGQRSPDEQILSRYLGFKSPRVIEGGTLRFSCLQVDYESIQPIMAALPTLA